MITKDANPRKTRHVFALPSKTPARQGIGWLEIARLA